MDYSAVVSAVDSAYDKSNVRDKLFFLVVVLVH